MSSRDESFSATREGLSRALRDALDEAEAVADTLSAAAKGLMRSGDVHVSKAKFEERIQRLVAWAIN